MILYPFPFIFSYVNTPNVDFTNVNSLPIAQEFNLLPTDATSDLLPVRYATRAAKFFNVNNLTLLLEGAQDGGNFIELDFLGFEGEFSQVTYINSSDYANLLFAFVLL